MYEYEILPVTPFRSEPKSGAAFDSHPDITIFQDEVIDIFAFSSVRRLNFTL